jgi:enoyl-CoA hydratase
MALAQEIAAKAPIAVRYAKQALQRGLELPLPQGCALEAHLFGRLFATQDQKEGTAAFLEKREPRFKGK